MFYKVTNNNMLVDLLTEVQWIRYLPRQKRMVNTDSQSANGVLGSDHNTVYHLAGRPNTFDHDIKTVEVIRISEEEYSRLSTEFAIVKKENADLHNELQMLKRQLNNQSAMLDLILYKLG